MILHQKNAVVYGAGGSLGNAVSKAFAAAGARVFLTGHRSESIQKTADEIHAAGGNAETSVVDAWNEKEVRTHLLQVVEKAGSVDIIFNAAGIPVKQNVPLINLTPEEFVLPVTRTLQTQFITASAAGKIMQQQGSGVILSLTATPGGIGYPYTGGFAPACAALETFSRNLASELGVYGVRVINIRSGGSPDSKAFVEAIKNKPEIMKEILGKMKNDTMLKELPLMTDIANAAVFLCSDLASKITGISLDMTVGTTSSLNYKVQA